MISQAVVEQVRRVPRRPVLIEYATENVRLVGAVGGFSLSQQGRYG